MRKVAAVFLLAVAVLRLAIAENSLAAETAKAAAPPSCVAEVKWDSQTGDLSLQYHDGTIFKGQVKSADGSEVKLSKTVEKRPGVEQRIVLQGKGLKLTGTVAASDEAPIIVTVGSVSSMVVTIPLQAQ